jgi:hypothetical protein
MAAKKTTTAKKSTKKPAAVRTPVTPDATPLVAAQPQSKQLAAASAGMFLYTDDSWTDSYFKTGDFHSLDRELFG